MSGRQVEELEHQVQETRARLGETVDELNRRAEEKMHKAAELVPLVLGGVVLLVIVLVLRKVRHRA